MAIKIGSQLQQRIDEEKQKNSAGGNASGSSSVQYYQPGSGSNSSSGSNQSRSYGGTATYTSGGATRTVQANTTVKRDTDSPLQRAQERTAQQQLQFQPAQQEKYYKGDKPTLNEAYAQAYRISQTDPEQGRKLFSDLDALSKDETSMFYQPYATATNKAITEMSKLGWDMSGGVTQKWIDDNAYLMQYARTVTGDTPLAPTKKSSKQENAAYWYYQIAKEETKTQKAEQEWSALQNEIAYWTQHPANYSDEQILNKINWKNYSTLNELDKDAALGVPTRLNRGILYSRDNLGGLIWANRNESTGDIHADAVQALLGQGKGWVEDKKVSARLDPTSSSFNPYAVSSTMDDVGMYYGRFGFDQKWLDDNASMKNSMDATEQKNYARVYTAEQTTQKAEAETKALLDKANYYLSKSFDADKIIAALKDDDFAKDYPTLAKMDESLKSGKLLDTTRAIGYDWEDLKRQIVDACEKNKAANPTASANETAKSLGGDGVFSENAALINAAGEAKLDALMGVVDGHGTEREKGLQKWLRTTTDTLSGFVGWVQNSKPDPIVSAEAMRQVDARNANANYMGLRTVTAGYEQRQTALEKDKQDLEKLNAQIAADEERKTKAGASIPTSGAVSAYAGLDDYNKSLIEMQIEADADPEMISTALSNLSGKPVTVTENDIEQIRAQRTQSEEAPQDTWTPQDENWLTVQKERQAELARDIEESQAWLDQNLEDYNAKRKEEEKLAKQYMQTSGLAEMLGVSSNDGAVELELMDYLYEVGSTYEETQWSSALAYDMAIADGQTAETLQPTIQRNLLSNSNDVAFLESILTQADERKINLPDGFADNIQRRIDALRKENKEYAYCMLDGMEDFQSVVAEGRRKYSALKPEDITKDNSYGAAMAGNVAFLYSRNAPLDSNGLPTDARMENALAMTDAEKDRYFYLVETEGYEAANKYLDFLQDSVLQVRKMEGLQQAVQNFASENGWQAALATTASFGTNLLSGAGALYSIWQRITGNEINPYNRAFTASVVTGAARQGTSELIDKASGGSKLAQDGYSIFYNGVDSWLSSVFTGPMLQKMGFLDKLGAAGKKGTQSVLENILGATPMGMRAMDSAIREAKLRGASDSQAMALGLANFVAETFSEGFTYSNIRGVEGKALTGSLKEFLLNLPKDGLEEAFGEGSAELVESMADTWIMGANSKREETIQAYLEQGYPKAVATRMADEQMIKDVFHAACIGFVSSGVSSTLGYAKGRAPEVAAKASNYVVQKVFGPEVFSEIQKAEVAPVRYTQNQATITALGVNAQGSQDTQNPSAATVSDGQGATITSQDGNAGSMYEEETEAPDVSDMYIPAAPTRDIQQEKADLTALNEQETAAVTPETVTPVEETPAVATEETVTPTPIKDIQQEKADLTALNEQESQQPAATEEAVTPAEEAPAATEETVDQDEYDSEDTPIEAYDVDNDALAEQDAQAAANLEAQAQAQADSNQQKAKDAVILKNAAASPNATTATVSMAAVLDDLGVAPITNGDTQHTASAAAVELADMAGSSQDAASVILDVMAQNLTVANSELSQALTWGALSDGETHQMIADLLNGTRQVDAATASHLAQAYQDDQSNASFQDMWNKAKDVVKQHRIAVNAQNQIASGALGPVDNLEAIVKQKIQNAQNAQAGLEQAQAQVTAAQANVDTATAEHLAHADDPSTVSPVQQAVKDLEGAIKVEQEYQQSVANAQSDLQAAKGKQIQAEADAMTAIHEQAVAEVEQQVQAEDEAAAQAQALAEQQAQEAEAQAAAQAQQAYDDAVAKYPPSKGFGKTIQMDMVGGETVDVVGVLYHDNDNTIFIGSDGRLIDDNDVIEYLGDGQKAVSDTLVNWKKSDNLKDLSSIPWQFDHVATLHDEDGNTVQAVGFTGTSGPDADGDYKAIWVLGLDGQEHNVSSDIMNTTYSADNFQDANYANNTFFENELAIPVRDSVLGQPVATTQTVTSQDNTATLTTPEAVTPEAQQPAAATPVDVNAQPAEAPAPTAQVPLPFKQPITATYKDVNGKKQTAAFVGMYNLGDTSDVSYVVTDSGAHIPLSSVSEDGRDAFFADGGWPMEMQEAANAAFNQATNVPLPFDEPIKASYFAPDGKRAYTFIGAINYDKNDIGSTYLVADTGELVSASHFLHNSSFRDQIKYGHSWSQNQVNAANAAFTQDIVDNWPVPQKTKAEPYLEKPGKNTPDPDLQLQPWQDPELHGKVKKLNAKKANPKSAAFKKWFNDPTPGKLLSNPDGSPKVFFRGFGAFTSNLLVNHKSNGKRVDPDQPKKYRNFYSDLKEVAADYAGTDKVLTFRDIVNWETAAAAMKDIGYSLKAEQNPQTGEWGYQVYNKYGYKADGVEHGGWYAENELSAFRHTYGGGLQTKGIHAGYISCQKPLVYDAGGSYYGALYVTATAPDGTTVQNKLFSTDDLAEWAFDHGFDTVIVQNVKDTVSGGGPANNTDIITSSPDQFKSQFNVGKFGKSSNILYSKSVDNGGKNAYALSEVSANGQNDNVGQLPAAPGRDDGSGDRVDADAGAGRQTNQDGVGYGQGVTSQVRGGETGLRVLSQEAQNNLQKNGVTDLHLRKETDQQRFSDALADGKATNDHGAYVDNQSVAELEEKGATMILSEDGLAGAAVGTKGKDKGNIFGVFKNGNSPAHHASTTLMIHAVAQGGNKLDCYHGGLSKMYERAGFVPVARVAFNEKFMPDGWNIARDDHPDIVFWMHNGDSADTVAKKVGLDESEGGYHHYSAEEIKALPLFDDVTENDETIYGYDRAWAYRDQLLAKAEAERASTGGGVNDQLKFSKLVQQQRATQTPGQKAVEKAKPKYSPARIAKRLSKELGLGFYSASGKKLINNAAVQGYYDRRAGAIAIRNKQLGNFEITMHEAGHALADKLELQPTQEMVDNLVRMEPEFASAYKPEELPHEAMAEFMWRYMENEQDARDFAGDAFYDEFEWRLKQNKADWEAVYEARADLQTWLNADANEQIGAVVQNRSDREAIPFRQQVRAAVDSLVDNTSAAEAWDNLVREATGKKALDASESLRKAGVLNNTWAKRVTSILTGAGLTDANWNRVGKSLAERFRDVGFKYKDVDLLNRYMLALHSLDRDAQGKAVFDEHVTREAREAFIRDVQQNHPTVAAAEEQFQAFRREFMQEFMVKTGRLSQEAFNMMESMYPHYVPTMRVKSTDGLAQRIGKGKTYTIKHATGSTEDIYNPMDSFFGMVSSIVQMTSQNNVALAMDRAYQKYGGLGDLVREIPNSGADVQVADASGKATQVQELLAGQIDDDLMQQVLDVVGRNGFTQRSTAAYDTIKVQRPDGKVVEYQTSDPELFKLLAGVSDKSSNQLMDMFGVLTRTMASLTTGSNPVFALRNFMRDFQNSVNYGSWAGNYVTGAARWLRTFAEVWKGNSQELQDYEALGGGGWTRVDPSREATRNELNSEMFDDYYKSSTGKRLQGIGKKVVSTLTLERLNEVIETTSRFAEYKYGKHDLTTQTGRQDAFLAAQDVTVDFNRSGNSQLATMLKKFIPFFNASTQGVYRTSRMLTAQEQEQAGARITKTIVNTALTSAIASGLLLKFSDDDEKEDFARMSSEMKAQHFYLPNFAPDILGDAPLIRIPLAQDPLTYAVHGAVTDAIWSGSSDGLVIQLEDIANQIIDNFNPLSNGTILDSYFDVMRNKTYYGSNIVPTYLQDLKDPTIQYTETTPSLFVDAGRMLNMSPMHVQYMAEQLTGFVGQLAIPAMTPDASGSMGIDTALRGMVNAVRKKFTSDPLTSSSVISGFYDTSDTISNVVDATNQGKPLNQLRRGLSDAEYTAAYEEAKAMTSKGGVIYDTKQAVKAGYTEIDRINADSSLTDRQKYEQTSAKRREMIETALAANEKLGEWMDKYVTGGNLVVNSLKAGAIAHKPTEAERMGEVFRNDLSNGAEYMSLVQDVVNLNVSEGHGWQNLYPHPATEYTYTDKLTGEELTYTFTDADKAVLDEIYRDEYQRYLESKSLEWSTLDAKKKRQMLSSAHSAANKEMKKYFEKMMLPDIQ